MSTKYGKILNHPDRDQITSKLASGDSVRSVSNWLRHKYPNSKKNHVAFQTLDDYRKNFLNIKGAVLEDLKQKYKENQLAEIEEDLDIVVKKNKTYKELKKEALKKHVNLEERMFELVNVMDNRVQHLYDNAINNPSNLKTDEALIKYFAQLLSYMKEIRKAQGEPDQIIQHNVAIQTIDQQASIIQQAIQEAVSELDLETASIVMEKIVSKVEKLQYKENMQILGDKEEKNIEMIEASLLPKKNEGEYD
jgi:hypothetical protein